MQSTRNIRLVCIPPPMLGDMWPHVGPYLVKGEYALTGSMHAALTDLNNVLKAVHMRRANVWAVMDDYEGRVIAGLITELYEDEGRRFLWVSRMGGERIQRWGHALSETMNDYAKAENADCVRFYGRKALQRAYKYARPIDQIDSNTYLYEGIPS